VVSGTVSGVDFVLPPEDEAVVNGGWESGSLSGWHSGVGVEPTVALAASHTGRYGLHLEAIGGTLGFWEYITQSVSIPATWTQPTLSFLYRVVEGDEDDALLATVSEGGDVISHSVPLSADGWTHSWHHLDAFSGQTVTLQFGFRDQTTDQQIYLDEISVGDTRTGVFPLYLPSVARNS
jgi:hypothetical protein